MICYIEEGGEYKRVYANNRILRRFSRIYRIDEKEESVAYWRQSVHNFLLTMYKKVPFGNKQDRYCENYFLPHIPPSELKNKDVEAQKRYVDKTQEVWLMQVFSECFCMNEKDLGGKVSRNYIKERYELWKSKKLFDLVKDMSLLAMYIFCISDYFQKQEVGNSWDLVVQEIFNARDMADGVLQILENIYHSEHKSGFFCFRVHGNEESRSRGYLQKHYADYMKSENCKKEQSSTYLEIKVADYSHITIPMQFRKMYREKMDNSNGNDRVVYQKKQNEVCKIKVRSFFEMSEFWQEYNSISENAVHHYGLQIFDSLVFCYDGYFQVRSQSGYKLQWENDIYRNIQSEDSQLGKIGIPGTQYDILLPFRNQKIPQEISLNVNINYTDYLSDSFRVVDTIDFTAKYCRDLFDSIDMEVPYQKKKELTIRKLVDSMEEKMNHYIGQEGVVMHFSANRIALTMIELFCKAIMLYFAHKTSNEECYIMVTDCTQSHFIEITRMMALFYDKQGHNSLMRGKQIFLSGEKEGEEFLITGSDLGEAIGSTEKLAFARCIHPNCLKILKKALKNHSMGAMHNKMVSIVPFDMLKYPNAKNTLFENSLQKVLNQDVQSEKFGCKLQDLHVRIGSKIHIRTFYEAELLFHNNYYTSRFAYWLFSELMGNEGIDWNEPLTLVGYENYSEMLLNELRNMLAKENISVDYIIYEQKTVGKFRGSRPFVQYKEHQFVIIVPVNSTLTTHIKVAGFLEKTIRKALEEEGDNDYQKYYLEKAFNYGIILISSQKGNEYWEKQMGNIVISKINGEQMRFFTEVKTKWSHPLKCEECFPKKNYIKELPLVETNKESVVPMHAISIRHKAVEEPKGLLNDTEVGRLKELSKFLVYDHVERNGNHFAYYFETEKLWDDISVRKNVQKWLEEQKKVFPIEECKVYDIIVAPLHFSNTAFVEEVNGRLFGNAAMVLHFDVAREFRMNIRTKFSSIQQLYDNLCESEERSIINFHYVDDTIISGQTFYRTKSLIHSMIKIRDDVGVKIHVFKSVILLLNRMSHASIRNYIKESKYFMAYFNLNISSMRVNSDACVLCKKYAEWNCLAKQASLNETFEYWKSKSQKIECKHVGELEQRKKDIVRQGRAERYMIASHRAKKLLDVLCNSYEQREIIDVIVDKLLPENIDDSMEEMIAMLKVLGRPFLTFRKEEKESVFKLMLVMLDLLLSKDTPKQKGKLYDILRQVRKETKNRTKLIVILINRLEELESNYLIRKDIMNRILTYSNLEIKDKKEKELPV